MSAEHFIRTFTVVDLMEVTTPRTGEIKVGQRLRVPQDSGDKLKESLEASAKSGAKFGLILVPEDIGPRANCGRGGSHEGPAAFLTNFANLQDNRFLDGSSVVAVGVVDLEDLMLQSKNAELVKLRKICADVDVRVKAAVQLIFDSGLEPLVVGGGNNNSLPIIRALNESPSKGERGIAVLNCDPHADFRRVEDGRHSGNPFSFAHSEGIIKRYCVFGLHESYNSEDMLANLDKAGYKGEETFENQAESAIEYLKGESEDCNVGIEVDLDSIIGMPSSAKTPIGLSGESVAQVVHQSTTKLAPFVRYLHLSEGAPRHSSSPTEGQREVGKTAAMIAATYIKARIRHFKETSRKAVQP